LAACAGDAANPIKPTAKSNANDRGFT